MALAPHEPQAPAGSALPPPLFDTADHFVACTRLGRYLTVMDGSRFVITDDFRDQTMGGAEAAAIASIFSKDHLVAQAALLPLGREAAGSGKYKKFERLFDLIEKQTFAPEVKAGARHILEHGFREAEIRALEAELGDKLSPARLRYRAFLGVVKQLMEGRVSPPGFLDEFREFTRDVAGKLDFGIYSFSLDRVFGNTRIPMKVKKLMAVELIRFPALIRRELITNLLAFPGQAHELISFVKGLVMAELEPSVVVEIELLETFKRNRMSMRDIERTLAQNI